MSSTFRLALAIKLVIFMVRFPIAVSSDTGSKCSKNEMRDNPYDYIIVGGGITGLVVANRLTENDQITVLVIERGGFDNSPRAIIPYWANDLDTSVMIRPLSAPVSNLNNATVPVSVAAVVGGGSVVNGMGYYRGSKGDYNSWEELGNPGWGWDGLLPYFLKSSTFIPPSTEAAAQWNMTWDPSVYDNGPVHVTIPDFQYPDVAYFRDAWKTEIGIDLQTDISAGSGPGIYWSPSTIDRRDETRVTARKEYYDPVYSRRPNLHLQTGQTVIEILFQNLTASGIRMISRAKNCTSEIYAKKEVILAAGAVKTPQLLQLSGIGPKDVLNSAGIEVKKDVPAVGANFQDNPIVSMLFNITAPSFPNPNTISTNETYNATVWNEYSVNRTGPIAAGRNSFGAFLSLSQLSTSSASIASRLSAQNASQFLPSVYNFGPLLRGFEAQRRILAKKFTSDSDATSFSSFRGIGLSPSVLLKPLSRGTITLNLTDPWGEPVVQYNTLMNPIDTEVILAIVKRQRAFWKNSRLAPLGIVEIAPGIQYQTDDEMLSAITKDGVLGPTFAHPSGTCAMMPEELGGCVSPSLQVYGVQNLSIVDASILPLITGAGLQATMYAVAEKAADLIKARAQ